jgi:hypothetical protein
MKDEFEIIKNKGEKGKQIKQLKQEFKIKISKVKEEIAN